MSDILIMLLICVESDKRPLLHKMKQLYKRLPVGGLIVYTANDVLYKLYTKMASLFLAHGLSSRDENAPIGGGKWPGDGLKPCHEPRPSA